MSKYILTGLLTLCLAGRILSAEPADLATLAHSFAEPPPSARPWVYWTWIDGNINKEGITADLEAMQRVGIGGAIILDVSQSMPAGPVKFFDTQWQALFKHTITEAKRLGLEINVNNGVGYYGSGGTWVPPEKAMQSVVQSEVPIEGGTPWTGKLPRPNQNPEYHDIGVVAVKESTRSKYRMPGFTMKALQWKSWVAYKGTERPILDTSAPADAIIPLDDVIDLTSKMLADGSLTWNAPAGNWTIIRFGHCWNGSKVGPSHPEDSGPETDKLSKAATDLHFNAFVKRLNDLAGPGGKGTLVATHIDSWEGGGQNWTAAMRNEFKKRRGYDPVRYLPILTGRILGDLQISERFLFDLRKTVSELMIENYTAEFQRLAHAAGLRNSFESYTTIGNDLDNASFADEPTAEFWTPNGQGLDFQPTIKSMSSSAHLNGRAVVGAESFTSGGREKFLWHPAMIKAIGDTAFCGGVNRFVFHRYASQPFRDAKPGMQMGPWGLHYERTNTWWEFSGAWHEYLTRCQYLLRQGTFVGDVLKLESEEPLNRFQDISLTGYDYDACGPDTFLHGTVRDGKVVFPAGTEYRLIVLPDIPTMSVPLLTRIRDMVRDGASILGEPPQRTPGLTDYPKADEALKALVDELWGPVAANTDHVVGKGHVFRGIKPEQALAALQINPDFTSNADLKYVHHRVGNLDIYFLSHPGSDAITARCSFRIAGKEPQLWNPETGKTTPLTIYDTQNPHATNMAIPFGPTGSAFIVFRPSTSPLPRLTKVTCDGKAIVENGTMAVNDPDLDLVNGEFHRGGDYVFITNDGKSRQLVIPPLPAPIPVTGPWQLRFPPGWGAPAQTKLDELISWSQSSEAGIKYFSGTAVYSRTLTIPALPPGGGLYLDLGKVQIMARVRLNGKELGVLWKAPYRIEITNAVKPGSNTLEIEVANLWVNRLIGDEQLPEDSDRKLGKNSKTWGEGTLKSWPQWLLDGKTSPTGRLTFSSWRLWRKDDPLQESGLIGPVTLQTVQKIEP